MKILDQIKTALVRFFAAVWALISDVEKEADPWKIAALIVIGFCVAGGVDIFSQVKDLPTEKLGILSGLVGTGVTIATFLFNQSRKSDAALLATPSGALDNPGGK